MKIDVLDHGYVRLLDHMGNDLTVAQRARHLPDAEWRPATEGMNDERLINYLMKHHHTSPFEFVEFDFHVKLPIFVARQWMRSRTWNFNEVSGRYSELPREFYVPDINVVGHQATPNKQGRTLGEDPLPDRQVDLFWYQKRCDDTFAEYSRLLEQGWPRELARCVLPLSTYTEMSAKVDLHNLFHFLKLRCASDAQYEIRVYAEAILKIIEPIVPVCVWAWSRHGGMGGPQGDL